MSFARLRMTSIAAKPAASRKTGLGMAGVIGWKVAPSGPISR